MKKTLVIIPTYNERENVQKIAEAVLAQDPSIELLIVDDGSPDGTGTLADELAARNPRIHVMHREGKQGLGTAYVAGFRWGLARGYDLLMEMDADFSHDPKSIPDFLKAAEQHDLVLGTRYKGGVRVVDWPLSRLLLSTGAAKYVRLVTGLPVTDPTGGFKCFRRAVLEAIDLDAVHSNGYSFQIEMSYKTWMLGFRIGEVPIIFVDRREGQSKISRDIVREAFLLVWKLAASHGFRRTPKEKRGKE
jgi:dolichol-phosphate mannosyltransferase